jgi:hypothetical protein
MKKYTVVDRLVVPKDKYALDYFTDEIGAARTRVADYERQAHSETVPMYSWIRKGLYFSAASFMLTSASFSYKPLSYLSCLSFVAPALSFAEGSIHFGARRGFRKKAKQENKKIEGLGSRLDYHRNLIRTRIESGDSTGLDEFQHYIEEGHFHSELAEKIRQKYHIARASQITRRNNDERAREFHLPIIDDEPPWQEDFPPQFD